MNAKAAYTPPSPPEDTPADEAAQEWLDACPFSLTHAERDRTFWMAIEAAKRGDE